jgi:bis(5'-nucleosidyl)-tetraphosphatase
LAVQRFSHLQKAGAMILSAGMIVVRQDQREWKYLFLRAYRNWDFPKGLVEASESPFEAAKREVSEETGITRLILRWGKVYQETKPYNRGTKIARYYLAETKQSEVHFSINPEIGKPEHQEYRWLTHAQIQKLAPPRLLPIIAWAQGVIGSRPTG